MNFSKQTFGNDGIGFTELQLIEKFFKLGNRHRHEFGNRFFTHFHIQRFGLQSCTPTRWTKRFSTITRQHDPVLYFIEILFEHPKKIVDAVNSQFVTSVPQDVFFFVGQIVIGTINGKIHFVGIVDKLLAPLAHFFASPALHTFFLNR